MHDNLLTQLARISALKVISRTSVMEYRDTTKNMRQIGQELGVATILEGGVQRAGDAVQINVQLIDVETDEHLWAETYKRQLTAENIFSRQTEFSGGTGSYRQHNESDFLTGVCSRSLVASVFHAIYRYSFLII